MMARAVRSLLFATLLGLLPGLCVISSAATASAQKRVAVSRMDGKGGQLVRAAAQRALKERSEVVLVPGDEVTRAAGRLGVGVDSGKGEISSELGISAWVEGQVEKDGKRVAITLQVLNGSNGETLGVMSYSAKNPKLLARTVEDRLWRDLGDLIEQSTAPAAPVAIKRRPEPEPEPAAEPEPEPERQVRAPARQEEKEEEEEQEAEAEPAQENEAEEGDLPSPFDVTLAMAAFTRSFEYNDALSNLRTYDLGLGPTIMVKLHWYPAAHFSDSVMAHVGIELRGAFAFGIDSELGDTSFPTSSNALGAGLRLRVPFAGHEAGIVLGYASQTFAIDPAEKNGQKIPPGIPEMSYSHLRLGIDLRFAIGDSFAIGASGAYLPVLSAGEFEEAPWFPHASGAGLEGELNASYALSSAFEITAAFGLQRFAFTLNPKLEEASANELPIAGGALDQYLFGTLGARYRL